MNIISFSLWGREPVYIKGMLRNLDLAPEIYPGWDVVVWADESVPKATLKELRARCDLKMPGNVTMFTRFLANDLPKMERFIVRDADSRLNERELHAVNEWIASGKGAHVIRDHPGHCHPIMGGLWGAKKGVIPSMASLLHGVDVGTREYMADQRFLWERVWPIIKDDCLQHDFCCKWPHSRAFPAEMSEPRFVGERFTENDEPNRYDWQKRLNFLAA